ncbi:ubiquitin carboxyl-terminal hydrolase 45-like isoform X2 [Mya arenaria]|uniref:ubiquitin carboxyl-terminal hydrolase 45-like isoform X2 n=1 Tax=Mya arenaria TaxID=6604 RepID=UPI0022DF0CF4|nr:ubiquitin carboxyl-terminal hydrolase 45-like isoform X2 [Mya arenaria]
MRVLEAKVTVSYSMGKKNKHKLHKHKENEVSDSSEDITGKGCAHVNKAVNFSAMKKCLAKQTFGECQSCLKDVTKKVESRVGTEGAEGGVGVDPVESLDPSLWVCLQCGHQGCGRMSVEKHALKHYETPRSSQHNIVINTTNWLVWCYDCDGEVSVGKSKKVQECLDYLRKQAGTLLTDGTQASGKNSLVAGTSGVNADGNKSRVTAGRASGGCTKVKGLSNLGNTCFFNAVMQNLVQTHALEGLLQDRRKGQALKLLNHGDSLQDSASSGDDDSDNDKPSKQLKELGSIEITLVEPGPLTHSLVMFFHDVNSTTKSGCINPSALFGQVCKKAPRFKGMQQQDSHELLRYLLDNMRTEEIKRGQSGILKHYKLSENTNPKKVDEETKFKIKVYGHDIKHTFVECLFGGQLISTVVCEECKYISQILEPFLDLSLPVTEEKPQRPNQVHGRVRRESEKEEQGGQSLEKAPASKDEPSKHMNKKQKKKQKRESRRQGKGKGVAGQESVDEQKEEEGEEAGQDGEQDKGDNHADDDSDADVEDNLESDTSKCYMNQSLSESVTSSDAPPPSQPGSKHPSPQSSDSFQAPSTEATSSCAQQQDTQNDGDLHLTDSACNGLPETNKSQITDSTSSLGNQNEQASLCTNSTVQNSMQNGVAHGSVGNSQLFAVKTEVNNINTETNGYMESESSNCDTSSADIIVNYSLVNGHLSESQSHLNGKKETMDTSYTFNCNSCVHNSESLCRPDVKPTEICNTEICNGLVSSDAAVKAEVESLQDGSSPYVNGTVQNGIQLSDNENETSKDLNLQNDSVETSVGTSVDSGLNESSTLECQTETSAMSDLSTLTSDISALSLADGSDALASEGSKTVDRNDTIANEFNKLSIATEKANKNDTDAKKPSIEVFDSKEENSGSKTINGTSQHAHSKDKMDSCNMQSKPNVNKQFDLKQLFQEGKKKSVNTLADRYQPSSGECSIQSCLNQFTAAELLTGHNKFGCKNCTKIKFKNNPNKEKKETVYSNANKQYLIFQTPAVLTLHLKRFEQIGFSSRKVNRHVDFPFVLDIAPYCSNLTQGIKSGQKKILYSLYGVVEHSGRLNMGHYTAYVKVRANIGSLHNFLNKHNVSVNEYLNRYAELVMRGDRQEVDTGAGANEEALVPPGRWFHISDQRVNEVTEASVERAQAYLLFYERIY